MAHGFAVQGGLGAGGSVIPHDSSAHSVLVPDTELLFTAQFHRAGPDLVLTGRDGQHHLIPGYFSSEHHPALVAPNGAHLSPATVDLLAGSAMPGHYAQAQGAAAPPDSIGKIEKSVGDVTVVRNGTTVALHVGDAVFKSDVVQTGANSSCGISFPDGTALNLVANTRMALNDYAFDANSNANNALFTLVEGTFAFVAGKVAHQGDMKITTPVATMGIRGTTGMVQKVATVTAVSAANTYGFLIAPNLDDHTTGLYDLILTDANGNPVLDQFGNLVVLSTVSLDGYITYVTPQGPGQLPLLSTEPLNNSQYAFEQDMLRELFRTLNPNAFNPNGNNGSSTTPPPFELPNPIPQLFEDSGKPFTFNGPGSSPGTTVTVNDTGGPIGPLTVVIWIAGGNGPWSSGPSWLGGAPPIVPQEVEILNPVKVTTDGADAAAGLVVNAGAILNIVSGTTFTIYDFIHGAGTIALNSSGADPTLFIHGGVSLVGGGTIKMLGPAGEDNILGVAGTGALLLNIDYTIEGTGTIGGGDGNLTFENFGIVNANDDVLTINTGNQIYNDGMMEATVDPLAATIGTLWIQDSVVNAGTVQADGGLAIVEIFGATFDNLLSVVAKNLGSISFFNVAVTNEAISATNPFGGTISAAGGFITFYGGSIANNNVMEASDGGLLRLENIIVTNSSAAELTIGAFSYLSLESAAVLGGTIENAGNVLAGGTSEINGDTVTNNGTIGVYSDGSLTLEGTTLTNAAGATILAADGGSVDIEINNANTTNDGMIKAVGGRVTIDVNADGSRNNGTIEADNGAVIINSNNGGGGGGGGGVDAGGNYGTITALDSGTVTINGGITNHTGATIDAIGSVSTVNFSGGETDNLGTIEADETGARIFFTDGMLNNANLIVAENDGAILLGSVLLDNESGALFEATSGGTIDYDIGGVTNDGIIEADNNGAITFEGQIGITNDATGTIEALSGGSIVFKAGTTGSVSNDGHILASGNRSTITFDSTLNGAQNTGTIEAAARGTVIIDGFVHNNALFNTGTIEATAGGSVKLDGAYIVNETAFFPFVNGTISATGTDAVVQLINATIRGGMVQSSGGGVIEATSGTSTLNAVTLGDGTLLKADTDATVDLGGDISIAGTVTFEGGGEFVLTPVSGIISVAAGSPTLINVGTIVGQGQIGDFNMTFENLSNAAGDGVVDANVDFEALQINTGNNKITNSGTLEASNGGTLDIDSSLDNSGDIDAWAGSQVSILDNVHNEAGGNITAEASGTVIFENISLVNDDGGQISTDSGGAVQIYDLFVTNDGQISAIGGSITFEYLVRTVTNECTGQIGAGNGGTITFGAVTVTNDAGGDIGAQTGGQVTFDHSHVENHGHIGPNGGSVTFDHSVVCNDSAPTKDGNGGITADGGGSIKFAYSCVTNDGAIAALDCSSITFCNSHVVNTAGTSSDGNGIVALDGGSVTFTDSCIDNTGFIRATVGGGDDGSAGTIYFTDSTINNACGTVSAIGADSVVQLADTTIKGGTLFTDLSGLIDVVASGDGDSTLDGSANTVTIQGAVQVEKGAALDLVGTVAASGTIDIVCGATVTVASGATLHLDSGTVEGGGALTIDCCAKVDIDCAKSGNISTLDDVKVTNDGTIQIDKPLASATLVLDDDTTVHCGIVSIGSAGTLAIETGPSGSGATLDNVTVHDSGAILVNSGATLTLDDGTNVNGCGAMTVNACSTLDVNGGTTTINLGGTITNDGTIEASCGGTLDIVSHVDNACGALLATSGGVLDIESAICGGAAAIHGGTLEFGAASNVDVTFCNGDSGLDYGTLVLDDATHFAGQIYGFYGTAAGACTSDTVELTGFCETSYSVQCSGGNEILTLHDGDRCVTLTFDDFNQSFKFDVVGGNTYIYDPPTAGATGAPATATTAAGNEHAAALAHQNDNGLAASPANEAGFGGDQPSAVTSDIHNGSDATPATNALAPPPSILAPVDGQFVGAAEGVFGGDQAAIGNSSEADAGALTNAANGGFTLSLLSSLLNVLTDSVSPIAAVTPDPAVLDSAPVNSTIVDGSGAAGNETAHAMVQTVPANELASSSATSPTLAASPPASVSFAGLGNDSFAFHPNLGGDTAQNTNGSANELAHNNIQVSGPALGSTAPEFHAEFALDVIHQDDTHLAATVDQFHQMASNATLLH